MKNDGIRVEEEIVYRVDQGQIDACRKHNILREKHADRSRQDGHSNFTQIDRLELSRGNIVLSLVALSKLLCFPKQ